MWSFGLGVFALVATTGSRLTVDAVGLTSAVGREDVRAESPTEEQETAARGGRFVRSEAGPRGGAADRAPAQQSLVHVRTVQQHGAHARDALARGALLIDAGDVSRATSGMGPLGLGSRASVCSLAMLLAFFVWLGQRAYKCCCSEDACWYNVPCVKKLRRALMKEVNARDVVLIVHGLQGLPALGKALVVGVLPRKGKNRVAKLAPKMCVVRTAKSVDGLWEQALGVHLRQGYGVMQLVVFKHGHLADGAVLGVATVDLRQGKAEFPIFRRSFPIVAESDGQPCGELLVSVRAEGDEPVGEEDEEAVGLEQPQEKSLEELLSAASGKLKLADSSGSLQLYQFRAEMIKTVHVWSWYSIPRTTGRGPAQPERRVGMVPIAATKAVNPVPKSISDFIVQYEDKSKQTKVLILQRVDQDRDAWVRNLRTLATEVRGRRTTEKLARVSFGASAEEPASPAARAERHLEVRKSMAERARSASPAPAADRRRTDGPAAKRASRRSVGQSLTRENVEGATPTHVEGTTPTHVERALARQSTKGTNFHSAASESEGTSSRSASPPKPRDSVADSTPGGKRI